MNKNASKFVNKLYDRVDAEINRLENKVYYIRYEKYPEEIYGLRYMKYTDPIEQQIEDLRSWKTGSQYAQHLVGENKILKEDNFRLKTLALSAANTIAEYGEYGKAELIRRQVK